MKKESETAEFAQERDLFNRAWEIMKRYYKLDYKDPDALWEAFEKECADLSWTAEDTPAAGLADDLSIAVNNYILALCKRRNATK